MKRLAVVAVFAGLLAIVAATPAVACSYAEPPSIDELASGSYEGRPVTGVYEQAHIDSSPSLGFRDVRTISVVMRYWGEPPRNIGREMHGDTSILGENSCGNESGSEGMIGYGWIESPEHGERRFLPWVTLDEPGTWRTTGRLSSDQERLLETAFGAPVVLEVTAPTRLLGLVQLWWAPALFALVAGALLYFLFSRHVRKESSIRDRFDVWAIIAGVAGIVGISFVYITTSDLDAGEFWPMILVLGLGTLGTWLSRPLGAAISTGWLMFAANHILSRIDHYPFRSVTASQDRAETAIGLLVVGAGVMALTGRHWSRWPASIALAAGAALGGSALWPVRGVVSWPLIGLTTLLTGSAALWFAMWRAGRFGTRWPWLSLDRASPGGGRGRLRSVEESPDSIGHGAG